VTGTRLLARTIHGIEPVTADELHRRGLGQVERVRHREVWFTTRTPGPELLTLRTADDLFLLATPQRGGVPPRRGRLGMIRPGGAGSWPPVEHALDGLEDLVGEGGAAHDRRVCQHRASS
jgi:tRNA (guanine6-N2)-methyltransferase